MRKVMLGIFLVMLILTFAPVGAVVEGPNSLVDTFRTLQYASNPSLDSQAWWVTLHSSIPYIPGLPPLRAENTQCAGFDNPFANCAKIVPSGAFNDGALHLELQPDPSPYASFWFSQVTDKRDAYSNGTPMKWVPFEEGSKGGVVTFLVRARLSPNYNVQGTAGAHGTVTIGLWNLPTYLLSGPPYLGLDPVKAIWVSYTMAGNLGGSFVGLHTDVLDQDYPPSFGRPTYTQDVPVGLNVSQWFTILIRWEADEHNVQKVTFTLSQYPYVHQQVFNLTRPLPALSLLFGMDSTFVGANGFPSVSGPEEPQWLEIDSVVVNKNINH